MEKTALTLALGVLLLTAQQASSTRLHPSWRSEPGAAEKMNILDTPLLGRILRQADSPPPAGSSAQCPAMFSRDGVPSTAQASGVDAVTYYHPHDSLGFLVDFCARPDTGCGKEAADAFCEQKGFDHALLYLKDSGAGYRCQATRYTSDPALFCKCDTAEDCTCDGFQYITCAQS
eukprot:evm.model.scf_2645.1 EVM.evm.TU.scf_2645.1   scf_2645:2360-5300(+)